MKARFRAFTPLFLWLLNGTLLAASPLQPDRLTCEYAETPFIDVARPRLNWTLRATLRNQRQTAYQVLVAESLADVTRLRGTAWDSGKVPSGESIQIEYGGTALKPFTRYYWRVRVFDANDEPSAWSQPTWFETALLAPTDWQAQWIGDGRPPFARDEDFYGDDPMPLLRRPFTANRNVASARLYVCGLGYYEAFLNGQKIGDHVLDPGWTAHRHQALYVAYDVTSQVRPGANVLGVLLGNGWYNPLPLRLFGRFNLRDVQQTGRPCLKAQLRIRYTDGSTATILTDESWQTAPGPVLRNSVYLGQHDDARREVPDWNRPEGNKAPVWKPAVRVAGPSGELSLQMQPPIRVTKVVKPVRLTQPEPRVFLFDLGQNFAGVARLRVQGPAGTRIRLRYGEDTLKGGTLNYFTTVAGQIKEIWNLKGGPGAPKTAWQEDSYTLAGRGLETWSPRFTFHGFRYVEVTGWPGTPTLDDLDGLRLSADLPTVGEFACSNDLFNRLADVVRWTFLSNVFSVQSDCPGREKMGYGADISTTCEAFLYNFDMAGFYRKTVRDFRNDQQPDGGITEIAPYTGIADRGYGGESGPLGWQLAFPYVQKQLYDFYGDRRILEENYPALTRQLQFLRSKADRNRFHWDISDHEALDPKPEAFSATAFYYHHACLAAEFAGILGKKADSTEYVRLAETIKRAAVQTYHVPRTGRFDNGTQSAQLFALWYGLSPEPTATLRGLFDEIERHGGHLSTGIFGTKMLFDVLRRTDHPDVAYRVANQRDFPGWGYMLGRGATTLWETWAYPDNAPSQNHPMFGSVSEWFYRSILGINAAAPGFARIQIKPQPTGDLTWARGSYRSVRGSIESEWRRENGRIQLTVSIPANTTAEIWVPTTAPSGVTEGAKPAGDVPGVRLLRQEPGYAVFAVGSGTYAFAADLK
jgi:alpha-L-rhamnosidase